MPDAVMLWAAACVCFLVRRESFGVDDPQYLEIYLKASNTDPFRQGVSVVVGKTDNVSAGLAYMVSRGSTSGQFFRFVDGRGLTRDRFVKAVRSALTVAGVDASHYADTAGQPRTTASRKLSLKRWADVRTPRDQFARTIGQQ